MPDQSMTDTLLGLRQELDAEREGILAQVASLHARREALNARIQPLEDELRDVSRQIKTIEQPRLRQIGNQLAEIARVLGATTLRSEG